MEVSIIILNWNGRRYLERCISAVMAQAHPSCEVILVDNGSTDGSADFISIIFPDVKVIKNGKNLGFSKGVNIGIERAAGKVIILLNPDVIVKEDWLIEMIQAMVSDEMIGIAGCKLLYPDNKTIQHAGGTIIYPLALGKHYGQWEIDKGQYDCEMEVDYVTGAAIGIRRNVFEAIGRFDERFFPLYYEDVDLCFRARASGFKVVYLPKSSAIHYTSSSLQKYKMFSVYSRMRRVSSRSLLSTKWFLPIRRLLVRTMGYSCSYYTYYHRNRLHFIFKHYTIPQLLKDFLPAEIQQFKTALPDNEVQALRTVYLEDYTSWIKENEKKNMITKIMRTLAFESRTKF